MLTKHQMKIQASNALCANLAARLLLDDDDDEDEDDEFLVSKIELFPCC